MKAPALQGSTEHGKENASKSQQSTSACSTLRVQPTRDSSQGAGLNAARDCPKTPAGRLPLAELVASGEDMNRVSNLTPVERVLWGPSARTLDRGSSQEIPALPRSRKRAYSSSPASSSQRRELSKHFAADEVPAQSSDMHKALKTPQGDPASDLWHRYSLNVQNNEKQSPTKVNGRPVPHLMNSSSPQTPAQALLGRESIGLRRSFSCSTEWPTSAAKRRKLQQDMGHQELPVDLRTADQPVARAQKSRSRLSLLVDKIHGDLARPPANETDDSSTSPVRSSQSIENRQISDPLVSHKHLAHQSFEINRSLQPLKKVDVLKPMAGKEPDTHDHHCHDYINHQSQREISGEQVSNRWDVDSDFGGDDLDFEMFEAVEVPVALIRPVDEMPGENQTGTDEFGSHPHQQRGQSNASDVRRHTLPAERNPLVPTTGQHAVYGVGQNDEFDDDANDVSAEDLEDAIAMFESQTNGSSGLNPILHSEQAIKAPLAINIVGETKVEESGKPSNIRVVGRSESSSDDEFGGDIQFEEVVAECSEALSTQPVQSTRDRSDSTIQRYMIMTVAEGKYYTSTGHRRLEKVLLVKEEHRKLSKAITLRQSWVDTPCSQGAYIHLIGQFDSRGQCIVDDTQYLLILHPDHLISATVVADSFSCTRRAVLQDRVKATGDSSEPQIYGSMLHEIFQEAMKANRWDDEWLMTNIEVITNRYLEKLFEIGVEISRAVDHLRSRASEMQAWAEVFVATKPKASAVVRDRNGAQVRMSINKLLEVEEKIWSPKYGLKGMIDATVQATLQDGMDEKRLTVPFEVKTGRNSTAAHKAQTALYTLLCSDRYDLNVACGILYYMENSETSRIPAIRHEIIHMIKQRNELAGFVRHKLELPPMLRNSPHLCGKCYAQKACFVYHRLADDGNGETSGLKELFDDLVKHLQPVHQQFFTKWDNLLTKEEKDVVKVRRELWTLSSLEREKLGRCFGKVVIEAGSYAEIADAPKINRYQYTFLKQKSHPDFSFTESQLTLGEPIVISDEKGHYALASGFVTGVRRQKLQVTVDRRLHNARSRTKNFNAQNNQSFAGIMEISEHGTVGGLLTPPSAPEEVLYRVDKDEFSNGMATVRNNLVNIMEKDAFNAQPLRRLIVENVEPTFRPPSTALNIGDSASQANLNVDQKRAIDKVMSAKDYALVLGMPGTGKTTTIAHIIRALTAQGKSVLLTSYTHTAVDNILLKIRKDNIGVFRLGAVAKVHPEVQEFAELGGRPMKTVEELKRAYGQQIVATTCLGINHPIFTQRIFDYCIVDEASQITLPVCLGPIRMARTFILVGDHYQLPPLVQNKEAQEGGLDVSLFKMLSDNQPSSVVNLEHQYRMCEDIMTLSNTLIYNGRLKCGTSAIAERSMTISDMEALNQHHHNMSSILSAPNPGGICQSPTRGVCWLRDLLDPSVKACFVNTDSLWPASREAETGSRITNPFEATLCQQLVEGLLTIGVSQTEVGVITLYRSQLALIKHNLRHRPGVEMHTADKFQGRDKEVVVLSLVRNNESGNVGELLKDWRRVNVALTRARTKLLVLGSKKTLEGNDLLKDFVELMEQKGWRYDLSPGALEEHMFEDVATQISADRSSGTSPKKNTAFKTKGEKQISPSGKEYSATRAKKVPRKRGVLDVTSFLERRPVLRDIANDSC